MTAEEKTTLARFLDLTGDYLKDGHTRNRVDHSFEDDPTPVKSSPPPGDFSSLPLAYQIDENENAGETDYTAQSSFSAQTLEDISAAVRNCKACGLSAARNLTVVGEGVPSPLVMVIGEGPGADEDKAGRPFVGRAGQLLDKMLASISLSRDKNCYIANMVKCRPPGNRDPEPGEIAACFPFLRQQILLLRPRMILCAGRVAAQNLLKTSKGINALRGEIVELKINSTGGDTEEMNIPVLCTFHPSAILRDESLKRPAWEDLKLLRSKLESFKE